MLHSIFYEKWLIQFVSYVIFDIAFYFRYHFVGFLNSSVFSKFKDLDVTEMFQLKSMFLSNFVQWLRSIFAQFLKISSEETS